MSSLLIKFKGDALEKIGKVICDTIRDQALSGINADGETFPTGVDIMDTGALLASIEERVSSEGLEVACTVPYAVFVDNRYHFFGVAPQTLPTLYQRLQPIVEAGAYFEVI